MDNDGTMWEQYGANPFSVINASDARWKRERRAWALKGINEKEGRDDTKTKMACLFKEDKQSLSVSGFDAKLCEQIYRWYSKEEDCVLDPFCGGMTRGAVASVMNRHYVGIDIRQKQVDANAKMFSNVKTTGPAPVWTCGDSKSALDNIHQSFDLLFTCPPYWNLEKYSKLVGDLSNMTWNQFVTSYRVILQKACSLLKDGAFAVIVVGEVRGRDHFYKGLVPMTIRAMMDFEMGFYDEAVYCQSLVNAGLRANISMRHGKLAKAHQNILVFQKPDRGDKRDYKKTINWV